MAPLRAQLDDLTAAIAMRNTGEQPLDALTTGPPSLPSTHRVFVPPIERLASQGVSGFMRYSTCSTEDFTHPQLSEICALWNEPPHLHRKLWEHAFIVHQLDSAGMLAAGRSGVGFGVGTEPLPAVFAGRRHPGDRRSRRRRTSRRLGRHGPVRRVDRLADTRRNLSARNVRERVSYRTVDMNRIPDDVAGFDFCWSSCCFEHLGSLQHGIEIVVGSVERTLRPGGVAVHTTEFNRSSDDDTHETPTLSIYRRRDIETRVATLESSGHSVDPFVVAPDAHVLDHFVDTPPYHQGLHIKLELEGCVTTSAGIVIRRGGA